MEDVLEILRIKLVCVIPEDQSVLRASNQGEPVILDINADAGKAYADTVERLLGEERPFRFIEEEKKGFLKRLFGGCWRHYSISSLAEEKTQPTLQKNGCRLLLLNAVAADAEPHYLPQLR